MLKNKKSFIFILICSILLLVICISAFAHPGRTDSNGGHYNRSTGEYHYHSGEYAGRDSSPSVPWYIMYLFFIVIIILIYIGFRIRNWILDSSPNTIIYNLEHALNIYKTAIYYSNYCDKILKEIQEKAIIPDGYEIGKDGLPKEIDSNEWGKSLTVYKIYNGWKLHLEKNCGDSYLKDNIYMFYNKRYSICKKCGLNYNVPNMEWYAEYLKLSPQINMCKNAKEKEQAALFQLHKCFNYSNTKMARFLMFFQPSKKQTLNNLKIKYNQVIKKG